MPKLILRNAAFALLGLGLAGCGAMERIESIGQAPALAPVGAPSEREIVTRIPRAVPITHANNSLWQPGAKSFFRDPRASNVGDIITVNITVSDAAKLSNSTARSRANSDSADLTNFFGLETVLPTGMTPGSLVNLGSDTSNAGNGSIDRSESISLTLAALVAQVLPNGNFVIDGRQQVRVNNEMRDLKVSGIVRAEDITQDNTVNLAQIAEARISYGGVGTVSDVQQPRYGSQLYDILMPW
ncbi:MAG TPA: flagellar basal body L-ring protein FlgH [Rhizomicrobium sp.]|nr:flagellar basal body L-ring protein FlgH [Rhizomicrobium sp.]